MASDVHDPADYVRRVRQGTRRFIEERLQEIETLRGAVASLEEEKTRLSLELGAARAALERASSLQLHAANIAEENASAFERYLSVEQENDSLANLYVSAYRLHGTLEPAEVVRAIHEIVVNLIGSEEFAILEAEGDSFRVLSALGVDGNAIDAAEDRIRSVIESGERFVADDGDRRLDDEPSSGPRVCIPLLIEGEATGAIAIFGLLEQKPGLERIDFEIFDLLATQAATALHSARLHARHWACEARPRR
ncbi:hypothetical protein MYXO_00602 [Myxococcaceae bacterium]|jgi:regulator of replication initiation timing|nr:hypothetical protein MYXO_00602 [Myxococcaceae bacterium]